MSHEESEQYSLRELIRHQTTLLEQHRSESNEWRTEIAKSIAKIQVHTEYAKEKSSAQQKDLDDLKTSHERYKGGFYILSLIGFGFIIDLIKRMLQ